MSCRSFQRCLRAACGALTAVSLVASCQWWPGAAPAPVSLATGGAPGFSLAPGAAQPPEPAAREAAVARLSGRAVADYCASLVSSQARWREADRQLMAYGDPMPTPPAASEWTNGLALTALGASGSDKATNGAAWRSGQATKYGARVCLVTREGKFITIDPDAPTSATGAKLRTVTDLRAAAGIANLQFTKTYVTLAGNGSTAFVVADQGVVFAIDVVSVVPGAPAGSHAVKLLATGKACVGGALFADPLASSYGNAFTTLYTVTNDGLGLKLTFTPGATFAASTFALLTPVASAPRVIRTPLTTAVRASAMLTPAIPALIAANSVMVQSPPVVLGGIMVIGDRRGYANVFDFSQAASPSNPVGVATNLSWPIEAPIAVDVDDNLALTDMFVASGPQLYWAHKNGTTWQRYPGQYALMQTPSATKLMNQANLNSFIALAAPQTPVANATWQAFTAMHSPTGAAIALNLPGQAGQVDRYRLSHSKVMQGLAPYIYRASGVLNRPDRRTVGWGGASGATDTPNLLPPGNPGAFRNVDFPVVDGDGFADSDPSPARLQGPTALDLDDDGSLFVADTNHCQVLFKPATSTSWQRWWTGATPPAAHSFGLGGRPQPDGAGATNQYFVFAGTLFSDNAGQHAGRTTLPAGNNAWRNTAAAAERDIGNGAGGDRYTLPNLGPAATASARGTAINRVHGVAVGNLGLYISNRNNQTRNAGGGTTNDGELLFVPRTGLPVGNYYGIANPQPGRAYVIARYVNGQGVGVWRNAATTLATPGRLRDIVFVPSFAGANRHTVIRFDSDLQAFLAEGAGGVYPAYGAGPAGVGSGRIAGLAGATGTGNNVAANGAAVLNEPHDACLDDRGNLFVANTTGNTLSMIANVVNGAGAPRTWGVAGPAGGRIYTIVSNLSITSPDSVTFANNDPQVPSGCLYVGLTGGINRVIRVDESGAFQVVAGTTASTCKTVVAEGGQNEPDSNAGPLVAATAATLSYPHRARGDGAGRTYICDRYNNRIRYIESQPGTGEARGYLSFTTPATAFDKVLYSARLRLFYNGQARSQPVPQVGMADPYLRGTATVWNQTNVMDGLGDDVTPPKTPDVDLVDGLATPSFPGAGPAWAFADSAPNPGANYYEYTLNSAAVMMANNPIGQSIRLGLAPPATPPAAGDYYYPSSIGVAPPYETSASFYTTDWDVPSQGAAPPNQANGSTDPRLFMTYGSLTIAYPILSPPAIFYTTGGLRYVFINNANCLFRYDCTWGGAAPTNGWKDANGPKVLYAQTEAGRQANGTVYNGTAFHFNATAPLVDFQGNVHVLDTRSTAPLTFSYNLNKFNGAIPAGPGADMAAPNTVKAIAAGVASTVDDNAGIYLTGGSYSLSEAYFGLVDGRLYRVSLK